MPNPNPQPCRSPYRLWVNGVALHACKCGHWMQADATLAPRQQVAS